MRLDPDMPEPQQETLREFWMERMDFIRPMKGYDEGHFIHIVPTGDGLSLMLRLDGTYFLPREEVEEVRDVLEARIRALFNGA